MRTLIGVAWPYASGPRHLGHLAGAYLPADIVARYHRLAGEDVLVVSGSDQHGTPVVIAAERAGRPVSAFADEQHEAIAATFERLGIGFDVYTKTTTTTHARVVHELFNGLFRQGLITEDEGLSAWCRAEDRALPDRYVEGTCPVCASTDARGDQCDECGTVLDPDELLGPRCQLCGGAVELRLRPHLYLRLDLLEPALSTFVGQRASDWRDGVAGETLGALRTGLRPRAVTRDLDWGVRVPLDGWDEHRLYVWFDAVIGYLSATVEWAERRETPDAWRQWWQGPDLRHCYFVGKDNTWFHTLWWPAILLGSGAELHLPDEVIASQYLTEGGSQLSTSRGRGATIDDVVELIGVDPLRHALCALSPETQDTGFTLEQAEDLRRTGLLGAIANPAHRVATMVWRRFGGTVGTPNPAAIDAAALALERIGRCWGDVRLRKGMAAVHDLGREVNRRLGAEEPWRQPDDIARQQIADLVPLIDALAIAAWPVVPSTAERIRLTFGRTSRPCAWSLPAEPARVSRPPEPSLDRP